MPQTAEGAAEPAAALTPPTNEVFIGALPRQARLQTAIATALHDALLQFAGTTDRTSVQLRMHSSSDGRGFGIAFAWLPDEETAQRLVAATELHFEVEGKRTRAGIRAARGRADARAPPSSDPGRVQLSIAVFASFDCRSLVASFDAWRQRLRVHGAGLELQMLRPAGGGGACARRRRDVHTHTRTRAHWAHLFTVHTRTLRHATAHTPSPPTARICDNDPQAVSATLRLSSECTATWWCCCGGRLTSPRPTRGGGPSERSSSATQVAPCSC